MNKNLKISLLILGLTQASKVFAQQRDSSSEIAFGFVFSAGLIIAGGYFLFLRHNRNKFYKSGERGGYAVVEESGDISSILPDSTVLLGSESKSTSSLASKVIRRMDTLGMGGVYVCVSSPSSAILDAMSREGIPCDDIMFIDCVQKAFDPKKIDIRNTVFIENPSFVEEILMEVQRIREKVSSKQKFLIIDSISSLLLYNKPEGVGELVQRLINKARIGGDCVIMIYSRGKDVNPLIQSIQPMMDSHIVVGKGPYPPESPHDPASMGSNSRAKTFMGSSYLVFEKPPQKRAMRIFFEKVKSGGLRGMCISRESPDKLSSDFETGDSMLIWLTDDAELGESTVSSRPLDISIKVDEFLKAGENSIILLDGLQYIVNEHGFKSAIRLIATLKDRVARSNSLLLIPIMPQSFEDVQMGLLESELQHL